MNTHRNLRADIILSLGALAIGVCIIVAGIAGWASVALADRVEAQP